MKRALPLFLLAVLPCTWAGAATTDDFATVVAAHKAVLVPTLSGTDSQITAVYASMVTDANSWIGKFVDHTGGANAATLGIFTDETYSTTADSSALSKSFSRLRELAILSQLGTDSDVKNPFNGTNAASTQATITQGLTWLMTNDYVADSSYTSTAPGYGNWYDWSIAIPISLNDILALAPATTFSLSQVQSWESIAAGYINADTSFNVASNLVMEQEALALGEVLTGNAYPTTDATDRNTLAVQISKATTAIAQQLCGVGTCAGTHALIGDGLYPDGSYIEHTESKSHLGGIAYTGGYGVSFMQYIATVRHDYAGASIAMVSSDTAALLLTQNTRLLQSYKPFLVNGEFMQDTQGRNIARSYDQGHAVGRNVIGIFLQAAYLNTTATDAINLLAAVAYWLAADTTLSPSAGYPDLYTTQLAEKTNPQAAMSAPSGFSPFPDMDRAVYFGTNWAASVAMFSSRRFNYEVENYKTATMEGENAQGWHTGDGMLYLYNKDLLQYSNDYWATINRHLMEGTTVEPGESASGAPGLPPKTVGLNSGGITDNFVGSATSYTNKYGLAFMQYYSMGSTNASPPVRNSTLQAKKAWFFFPDQVVALGAGITASDSSEVETVVADRMLTPPNTSSNGTNAVTTSDGTMDTASPVASPTPTSHTVSWTHIADNTNNGASTTGVGYYFLSPTTYQSQRQVRTDCWNDESGMPCNATSATTKCTAPGQTTTTSCMNNFYIMTVGHGQNPSKATYAYTIFPDTTASAMKQYASSPTTLLVANSSTVQSIRNSSLGVNTAVFWSPGKAVNANLTNDPDSITVDQPVAVVIEKTATALDISVSDPTQINTNTVTVTLNQNATSLNYPSSGGAVTVTSYAPLTFTVALSGLNGKAQKIQFSIQ
ncbi:MAG: polysaccharide lyase family 8 super-sandwich domain-containing protein [Janthinobacterium lividum]